MDGEELVFQCSGCGACCRRAGQYNGPDFNEPIKEDGSCAHLQEDNSCAIYEDRPEICRVREMYHKRPEAWKNLSLKEYYKEQNKICNHFVETDKLDEKYLIDINSYD